MYQVFLVGLMGIRDLLIEFVISNGFPLDEGGPHYTGSRCASSSDLEFSACTITMMDIERVNPLKHEVPLNNRLYLKNHFLPEGIHTASPVRKLFG
jgi:hypothetical protein